MEGKRSNYRETEFVLLCKEGHREGKKGEFVVKNIHKNLYGKNPSLKLLRGILWKNKGDAIVIDARFTSNQESKKIEEVISNNDLTVPWILNTMASPIIPGGEWHV